MKMKMNFRDFWPYAFDPFGQQNKTRKSRRKKATKAATATKANRTIKQEAHKTAKEENVCFCVGS